MAGGGENKSREDFGCVEEFWGELWGWKNRMMSLVRSWRGEGQRWRGKVKDGSLESVFW